jgi:hypothetical protein
MPIPKEQDKLSIMGDIHADQKAESARIEAVAQKFVENTKPIAPGFESVQYKNAPTEYKKIPEPLKVKDAEKSPMTQKIQDDAAAYRASLKFVDLNKTK